MKRRRPILPNFKPMIVKCEQCQTRFKIPDDKVTEKGVKVRCTKCQHTFRVKKEGEATTPAGAPVDPFSKFGPPPAEPDPAEQTRPAMYAVGVQASKTGEVPHLTPSFAAQADLPAEAFDSPTRVGPPPTRKPSGEPAPFDFSGLGGPPSKPAPKSSANFESQPFDFGALGSPSGAPGPSEVTQRAAPPGSTKPSSFEPQPFDFSGLTAPPPEPPKPEVTRRERAPQPTKPSSFEPQPFDFSSLESEPPPETTQKEALRAPAGPAPASSFEPQPFDFSSLGGDGLAPPPPPPAPKAPPPKPAAKSAPPSKPPPPRPSPVAVTQVETKTVPPPGGGGLLDDVPIDSGSLSIDMDDGLSATPGSRGSLFDMSSAPPEATENQLQPAAPQEQVAVAKIALKKVTADQLAKPATGEKEAQLPSRRPKRSVVAMVWNVLSGFVLLALLAVLITTVLNGGKVDAALSWSRLKSAFSTPRELVAFDISNGLYDTRAGRPVFYVRGEVKNRGSRAGKVKVMAEILDGEDLVQKAEGLVGATPSPEDLYAITNAEDLAKLSTRIAPNAVQLKPGTEDSFLVAFYEYPPDLKDFRVRVTATPQDGTTAAR